MRHFLVFPKLLARCIQLKWNLFFPQQPRLQPSLHRPPHPQPPHQLQPHLQPPRPQQPQKAPIDATTTATLTGEVRYVSPLLG